MLSLRAGLRYTHDTKELSATRPSWTPASKASGTSADLSDSKPSGDLSVHLQADARDANVYARVATGYRGSSVQPPTAFGPLTIAGQEDHDLLRGRHQGRPAEQAGAGGVQRLPLRREEPATDARSAAAATPTRSRARRRRPVTASNSTSTRTSRRTSWSPLSGSYNKTVIKDPNLEVVGLRRRLHDAQPQGPGDRRVLHRRQRAAERAEVDRQPDGALRHPDAGRQRVLRLHRLGLPQQGQLLPLPVDRVHRPGVRGPSAACGRATSGTTASTRWRSSAATSPTRWWSPAGSTSTT